MTFTEIQQNSDSKMDQLIWVQTTCECEEPHTHVWWPALKYPTQDDLFKTDTLVRGNDVLKRKIFASNLHLLTNKSLLGNPVARLLGHPPGQVVVEWLISSKDNEKAFFDDFVSISRQFDSLPEASKVRSNFDQAVAEALSRIKASEDTSPVDVPPSSQSATSSDFQPIRKVLKFNSGSSGSRITFYDTMNDESNPPVKESTCAVETTKNDAIVRGEQRNSTSIIDGKETEMPKKRGRRPKQTASTTTTEEATPLRLPVEVIRDAPTEDRADFSPDSALTVEEEASNFDCNEYRNRKEDSQSSNERKRKNSHLRRNAQNNKVSPEKTIVEEKKPDKGQKITSYMNKREKKEVGKPKSAKSSPASVLSDLSCLNTEFGYGWEILRKNPQSGFSFRADLGYILPDATLLPESQWKENKHYFKDGSDLRKSLCRDGIPVIVENMDTITSRLSKRARRDEPDIVEEHVLKVFSEEDVEKLQRWVTVAHMPQNYKAKTFSGIPSLSDSEASKILLKKCGYKWNNSGFGYSLPETTAESDVQVLPLVLLRSHVCRHGILGNVDALSMQEHVQLTLWACCEPFQHSIFKLISSCTVRQEAEDLSRSKTATPTIDLKKTLPSVTSVKKVNTSDKKNLDPFDSDDVDPGEILELDTVIAESIKTFNYDDKKDEASDEETAEDIPAHFLDLKTQLEAKFGSVKHDDWHTLRTKKLNKFGKIVQAGLEGWVWVLPDRSHKGGVYGIDYFSADGNDLKQFAATHLGWGGDANFFKEKEDNEKQSNQRRNVTAPVKENRRKDLIQPFAKRKTKVEEKSVRHVESEIKNYLNQIYSAKKTAVASSQRSLVNKTVEEILKSCKVALGESALTKANWMVSSTNTDNQKDGASTNCENQQIADIMNFVIDSIKSNGNAGSLYVSGMPGCGKTTAVEMCLAEGCEWARFNAPMAHAKPGINCWQGRIEPEYLYFNVASDACNEQSQSTSSNYGGVWCSKVFSKLAAMIGLPPDSDLKALDERLSVARAVKKGTRTRPIFLVLDEIDLLLNSKSSGDGEKLLYTLFRWSSDPNNTVSLIGISNNTETKSLRRLADLGKQGFGEHPKTVVFKPYTHEQLAKIITLRVGEDVFDSSALNLLSRRIAAKFGDARRILEMAAKVVDYCYDSFSEAEKKSVVLQTDRVASNSASKVSLPLVKIEHVMKVVRDSNPQLTETILGQPRAAQVVLCVALSMSRELGSSYTITHSQLLQYCQLASQTGLMESLNSSDFSDIVKNLCDAGLLRVSEENYSFSFDSNRTEIQIGVQLEEVESALGETLGTQPTYAKITQRAKEFIH